MQTISRMTALESETMRIVRKDGEVDVLAVATQLAQQLVSDNLIDPLPTEAVESGIHRAIADIEEGTFSQALDAIIDRVFDEVEGHAKAIALRLLQETAANANRDGAECSAVGGN
jgi:hypothetical protein